ncbi:MAG: 50S ribosomal protein L10 [Planctomycetota bacterium]
MAHPLKEMMVDEMARKLQGLQSCVALDIRGIRSLEAADLRKALRERKMAFWVVKNSLVRIALKKAGAEGLAPLVDGPTALILGRDDPGEMSRVVVEWWKKKKKVQPRGAYVEGRLFPADAIPALAGLPTKPVMLSRVAGCFQAPLVSLAGLFQAHARKILGLMKAYQEKLQNAGSGAGAVAPAAASEESPAQKPPA